MSIDEIKNLVVSEVAKLVEQPESDITMELSLIEDLDLSSLEIMTLLGEISEKIGIKFEESELRNIETIEDMIDTIKNKTE